MHLWQSDTGGLQARTTSGQNFSKAQKYYNKESGHLNKWNRSVFNLTFTKLSKNLFILCQF